MAEIMMLEGLGSTAGSFVSAFSRSVISEVARDPRIRMWLHRRGYAMTKAAIRQVTAPASEDAEMSSVFDGITDAFMGGVRQAIAEEAMPALTKASLLLAGGGVLFGILVGRSRRSAYERGRAEAAR